MAPSATSPTPAGPDLSIPVRHLKPMLVTLHMTPFHFQTYRLNIFNISTVNLLDPPHHPLPTHHHNRAVPPLRPPLFRFHLPHRRPILPLPCSARLFPISILLRSSEGPKGCAGMDDRASKPRLRVHRQRESQYGHDERRSCCRSGVRRG